MKAKTSAIFGALTLLYGLLYASADDSRPAQALAILTRYEVKPVYQDQFRKALSDYVRQALSSASNIMAEAYYEQEKPNVLWLIERWTSKKDLKRLHIENISLDEMTQIKPVEIYMLKDLEPLTKQQWRRTAKKEDQPLTVILFVDAKKGTQENFKTIYHQAMPKFRSEPGVVTYQLSEIDGDSTQFVTYEKFRSNEAFQYHLKFPPIQPVLGYLNTSIKKPPFQDGIRNLVEFAPLTRE
jgi:quinol monooxygenase YgiN